MSTSPRTLNLTGDRAVYSGSDYALPFGAVEDGGRGVADLVLTSGSTTATSASAAFTSADSDKKVATADGSGIVDGSTMTYASPTTVTLSAPATATGTFVASIRALNASSYTTHDADIKRAEGGAVLATFTIDDARSSVGWFEFSLPAATTEPLSGVGVWDWRVEGTDAGYWLAGKVQFRKNTTIR